MMTTTSQRSRIAQLARNARRVGALSPDDDQGAKKLTSCRLTATEMDEANQLAASMGRKRGPFIAHIYKIGMTHYMAQENRALFYSQHQLGAWAVGADGRAIVPTALASLHLHQGEVAEATRLADECGHMFVAPFLRGIYLLGLELFKQKRGQVQFFGQQ